MGFVKLPSENPASDSQPQTSEASCHGESSEMRLDVQSLEETPAAEAPNQPSSFYTFPKMEVLIALSKAVGLSSFPGFIIMSQMTAHFAGFV